MPTAFGPQSPNFSLTRPPGASVVSSGNDTWVVNCSTAGAKDGTYLDASFFNVIIGNLRYCVRTAGVTLNDAVDTMLYNAINNMIVSKLSTNITASRGIRIVTTGSVRDIESDLGTGVRPILT